MDELTVRLEMGWRDAEGAVHRDVALRPARVRNELRALEDFRTYLRPESFTNVLLARVIVRLGPLKKVNPGQLESLDRGDLLRLEEAYRRKNDYAERSRNADERRTVAR